MPYLQFCFTKEPNANIDGTHKPTYIPSSLNPENHNVTDNKNEIKAADINKTVDFLKFLNIIKS